VTYTAGSCRLELAYDLGTSIHASYALPDIGSGMLCTSVSGSESGPTNLEAPVSESEESGWEASMASRWRRFMRGAVLVMRVGIEVQCA
jgi:hypothetical protein